jgi:hypothetical protein
MEKIRDFYKKRKNKPISTFILTLDDAVALLTATSISKIPPNWLQYASELNPGGYSRAFLEYLSKITDENERKEVEKEYWAAQQPSSMRTFIISEDLHQVDGINVFIPENIKKSKKVDGKLGQNSNSSSSSSSSNSSSSNNSSNSSNSTIPPKKVKNSPKNLETLDFQPEHPQEDSHNRFKVVQIDTSVTPDWPGFTRDFIPAPLPEMLPKHNPSVDKNTKSSLKIPVSMSDYVREVGVIPTLNSPIPTSTDGVEVRTSLTTGNKLTLAEYGMFNNGTEMHKINKFYHNRQYKPISQYFKDLNDVYTFIAHCFGRTPTSMWLNTYYNLGGYSYTFLQFLSQLQTPYQVRQAEHEYWTKRLRRHETSRQFGQLPEIMQRQLDYDRKLYSVEYKNSPQIVAKLRTRRVLTEVLMLRSAVEKKQLQQRHGSRRGVTGGGGGGSGGSGGSGGGGGGVLYKGDGENNVEGEKNNVKTNVEKRVKKSNNKIKHSEMLIQGLEEFATKVTPNGGDNGSKH